MGQRSVPAPFLMKTYELVDDPVTNDVISWGDEGTTFVVWKTAEFAKDLLPKYFKHNNFSSFVRQLNTYGFRKIVPDKWEFSNDNFKRDDKSLLVEIRRRKATILSAAKLTDGGNNQSQSVSGDEAGSTSTSMSPGTVGATDLSGENDKLRRDNELLSSELARTKKQCDELVAFLTRHLNVGPDQIDRVLQCGLLGAKDEELIVHDDANDEDDDENEDSYKDDGVKERKKIEEEGLKLFGVWLKEVDGIESGRKRGRCGDLKVDNTNSKNDLGFNGPDCGRKFMRSR
ncbi:heat shock factor protein HSF24 [Silene latifolia]|uniref:heat shock factor protein HSF24 n=1 Tax=Silene latifolia TaxID=37657 RepID=UPI003D76B27E